MDEKRIVKNPDETQSSQAEKKSKLRKSIQRERENGRGKMHGIMKCIETDCSRRRIRRHVDRTHLNCFNGISPILISRMRNENKNAEIEIEFRK